MRIFNEQQPQDDYQAMDLDRPTVGQLRLPAHIPQHLQPAPVFHPPQPAPVFHHPQPAPVFHPPQPLVLYLDLLPSDGDATKWKPNFPGYHVEAPDVANSQQFANKFCGQQDLQALCGGLFSIRMFPVGYQIMRSNRGDIKIYGHPSGSTYKTLVQFGTHIASMMKEDLINCGCIPCNKVHWRRYAPADAVIRVGLPRVPGGAVTVALAQAAHRAAQGPPVAQWRRIQPRRPVHPPVDPILAVDLSWTHHTRDDLQETLALLRILTANLDGVDAVVLAALTDNKALWEPDIHNFYAYVRRPEAHTVELDGLWQQWYEHQVAGFDLIRAQTKSGQAAQESWELLQRAKDVQNLPEWQKETIQKAILELEDVTPLGLFGAFH
ncbi:hypothetical protein M438DRAFT_358042 [Aureobasidium pullulans EXF-150]|uniref:Cryptic loci regulator 2 N-terminal domain-containing protein n=1 Tax=Aureobasidium pullulans EXF-150 TaxID=1043002 RepID=A0A074XC60_AURPU|nr:uncharacterized protein M438DRAFT_358042 [Aureobasidium pullulans EXF-150]KEQ81324.1 hypothetical protein M438DRAFT_358042 [Aureobasidium pullulans EXF-150]